MHEFTLNKSTDEMEADELRSTLDEFMDKHEDNVEDYAAAVGDRDEFSEKVDELEEQVSEYSETAEALQAKFSEIVAGESDLFDADEVADRFSLDELIDKADSLGAFSLATDAADDAGDDVDEDEGPTFADKPERAPAVNEGDRSAFRDQAESDLKGVLGDY